MNAQVKAEVDAVQEIAGQGAMRMERLPFTVRVAGSDGELAKAVQIRHAAYARHVPEFAESLKAPEAGDREAGAVVLLAESKLDGSPIGTMRIQTNRLKPLGLESSVDLPPWLRGANLAEATRLGVAESRVGRVVKTSLFKAFFLYCVGEGIDWMVITARKPIDRIYESLLFKDVYGEGELIPMRHVGNLPHRVMAFEVGTAQRRWFAAGHPLYEYMFRTVHPDIDVSGGSFATAGARQRPATYAISNRIPVGV